jgi:hypothetical protein
MEKTLKEQPERPRIDGTMRSDHSSLNSNLSPGKMDQQPPSTLFVESEFLKSNDYNFCFVLLLGQSH